MQYSKSQHEWNAQALSVQVLAPQAALQLLQSSESQEDRQKGLKMLPSILWQNGAAVQGFPILRLGRSQYLKIIRQHLSGAEQVTLLQTAIPFEKAHQESAYDPAHTSIFIPFTSQGGSFLGKKAGVAKSKIAL